MQAKTTIMMVSASLSMLIWPGSSGLSQTGCEWQWTKDTA